MQGRSYQTCRRLLPETHGLNLTHRHPTRGAEKALTLWNRLTFSRQEAGQKRLSLSEASLEAKPGLTLPSSRHVREDQVLYRSLHAHSLQLCSYLAFSWVYALAPKTQQMWVPATAPICGARAEPWYLPSAFSREHPGQKRWTRKHFAQVSVVKAGFAP